MIQRRPSVMYPTSCILRPTATTRVLLALSLLLILPPSASSQSSSLLSLVSAERAFARATAELGVRNGFLHFFADDAVGFEPSLGRYTDALRASPKTPYPLTSVLEWNPAEGDVSASGELGYLTGPYQTVANDAAGKVLSSGWYFSIWKLQPDSTWKVFIDIGIRTPPFGLDVDTVQFRRSDRPDRDPSTLATGSTLAALTDADDALNRNLYRVTRSFTDLLVPRVRLHRDGRFPIVGSDLAHEYLTGHTGTEAVRIEAFASRAGDIGYTFGSYTGADNNGYYVRVWSNTVDGWKALADITTQSATP